jgi:hypothetical protein
MGTNVFLRCIGLVASAALMPGCAERAQNEAITVCEGEILKSLRSPSTYKQIQASVSPPEFEPKVWVVSISYDAANAFGTPVRGGYLCAFKAEAEGNLPIKGEMELAAATAKLDADIALFAGTEPNSGKLDVFPCCLSKEDKSRFIALWPTGVESATQDKK